LISDKKPIIKIKNKKNIIKSFSKDKKIKDPTKKINPPVIGESFVIANDLWGVNFLSTKNCFFLKMKFKKNEAVNVNKIT
tara:strand:- start:4349 stop:4588 length:240 start_codon:yes stop_codon:yes gene_type:complete